MKRRFLLTLATLVLALTVVGPPDASALAAKNVTEPEAVYLGAGDIIESEAVAVWQKFYKKPERFALYLSLEELRTSGERVFLGDQTIPIAATTLLTLDGPDGRPAVSAVWQTTQILGGSLIDACVEVTDLQTDKVAASLVCHTLTPQSPL